MPGVPQKPDNQVALVPESNDVRQPRQPSNLQGLLRFAMEASDGPSSDYQPAPLDPERKEFLENALKSMTVNVTALLRSQIEILKDVENISESDVPAKLAAFETILEYVSDIDMANDFHKIEGFLIFEPCLKSEHEAIRVNACDLIAELAQNNPYIQNVICTCTNLMPTLLNLIANDSSEQVQVKAIYAVSCISRDSMVGYKNFLHHKGLEILKTALNKDHDKIRTKITFLLSALIHLDKYLTTSLLEADFPSVLVRLIDGEWKPCQEHILSLLHMIVKGDELVKSELRKDKYKLKDTLSQHLQLIKNKDECREEQFYCEKILKIVFK